jgi:hypothetical protein
MTCYIIYNRVAKLCILRRLFPYESVKRLTFHILPFEKGSPVPSILAEGQNLHTCTHYSATRMCAFCMSNILG